MKKLLTKKMENEKKKVRVFTLECNFTVIDFDDRSSLLCLLLVVELLSVFQAKDNNSLCLHITSGNSLFVNTEKREMRKNSSSSLFFGMRNEMLDKTNIFYFSFASFLIENIQSSSQHFTIKTRTET